MSLISIDECFSSPQQPHIRSERLKVKLKSQSARLTIAELKKAIVKKGYPSLCDPSRITLILPSNYGLILPDDMLASELQPNLNLLALVSSTSRETCHLQADRGLHLSNLLYVYLPHSLKTFIKIPHSLPSSNAGKWINWQTDWSNSFQEIIPQFVNLGFAPNLVQREIKRLEQRRLPDCFQSTSNQSAAGHFVPNLMFRLWDAAGLNRLVNESKKQILHNKVAPSEFEVLSASSCLSLNSDTTQHTIQAASYSSQPSQNPLDSAINSNHLTSSIPSPSVDMGPPSEHESAYDEVFRSSFAPPAPTVHESDCSSDSGTSQSESLARMDWTSGPLNPSVSMSTSSHLSKIIGKLGQLTQERDRLLTHSEQVKQLRQDNFLELSSLLDSQAKKFEMERIQWIEEMQKLQNTNAALREEVQEEVKTVQELLEHVDYMRDAHQSSSEAEATIKVLQEIKMNLSSVVTCSICCEQFGSLSRNFARRPIHLSCGHIFCASCLKQDWSHRHEMGLEPEARCFNKCQTFDINRLGEIYLLDDVKEVLEKLPDP
ncbi:hypothetical protein O181_084479 [Austropuccinia psidii MF-1]|uniref:RING-type domain-containing protein n=1 Tax=Austropuccinia psidii MF-1 TaxID=1389203 RepID=A0A9Q3IML8_9BASI|nr:hypothetical protein [Austropuccinia psidii MF-1]